MTLETVKKYLKVDEADDVDDDIIKICMNNAEELIKEAVGSFDDTKARVQILYLALVQNAYDHRDMITAGGSFTKLSEHPMYASIIRQLQVEEYEEEPEAKDDGL
jgi:uncharacterized phage protein (predicted DNA packaging)